MSFKANELLVAFRNLPNKFLALDTETTGFGTSDHIPAVISIGVVEVIDNAIATSREFFVRPWEVIEDEAAAVHGITNEQALTFPALNEQWSDIDSILSGQLIITHNTAFDWRVMAGNAERSNLEMPRTGGVLCSLRMAHAWAEANGLTSYERGPSLNKLTKALGVPNLRASLAGRHGALVDAQQLASVVLKLKELSHDC